MKMLYERPEVIWIHLLEQDVIVTSQVGDWLPSIWDDEGERSNLH